MYNLEKVQRIGAQTVVLASGAVALKVVEAEAYLGNTTTRLQRKVWKGGYRSGTGRE